MTEPTIDRISAPFAAVNWMTRVGSMTNSSSSSTAVCGLVLDETCLSHGSRAASDRLATTVIANSPRNRGDGWPLKNRVVLFGGLWYGSPMRS